MTSSNSNLRELYIRLARDLESPYMTRFRVANELRKMAEALKTSETLLLLWTANPDKIYEIDNESYCEGCLYVKATHMLSVRIGTKENSREREVSVCSECAERKHIWLHS